MSAGSKRTLRGRVILVQEDRFRVVGNSGEGYLFTLSYKAGINQEDLERFRDANIEVVIEYEGEPNLVSGIACRVEPVT